MTTQLEDVEAVLEETETVGQEVVVMTFTILAAAIVLVVAVTVTSSTA